MAIDDLVATRKRVKDQQDARRKALFDNAKNYTGNGNKEIESRIDLMKKDSSNRDLSISGFDFVGKKTKDGKFALQPYEKPARSRELTPEQVRISTLGTGKDTLQMQRKLNKPVPFEVAKKAAWQQKVDAANRANHLRYLLNGNRAQRLEGQKMLDEEFNKRLDEDRKRVLAEERQHELDLIDAKAQKDLEVARINADAARYNSDTNLKIAEGTNKTNLSAAQLEAKTNADVAQLDADTKKEIKQMEVASAKEIAEANRQATIDAAKIGADAEKYVGELQALAKQAGVAISTDNQLRAAELLVSINNSFMDIEKRAMAIAQVEALSISKEKKDRLIQELNSTDGSMQNVRDIVTNIVMGEGFSQQQVQPEPTNGQQDKTEKESKSKNKGIKVVV